MSIHCRPYKTSVHDTSDLKQRLIGKHIILYHNHIILYHYYQAIIVSRILYALPAWGVFMSAAQSGRIDAFLKRAHKINVDFLKNSLLSMSC